MCVCVCTCVSRRREMRNERKMRGRLEWRKGSQVTVQSSIRKIILAEVLTEYSF